MQVILRAGLESLDARLEVAARGRKQRHRRATGKLASFSPPIDAFAVGPDDIDDDQYVMGHGHSVDSFGERRNA